MYLLVLAFTFVNCYCFMILFLHLLSLFTYYVQIPFLNQMNKIFKLPYFFKISYENLFHKDTDNSGKFYISSDDEINSSSEETKDSKDEDIDNSKDDKTKDSKDEDIDNSKDDKTKDYKDEDTEDEELDKKSADIEDFIEIRKNKFLIDESLD